MLTLQVSRVLRIRGIQKPYNYLRKLGLSHNVVHRMLSGKSAGIKMDQLQRICLALHCTPNDLMHWDGGQTSIAADHPIQKLTKKEDAATMDYLRKLPLEKMEQIRELLEGG